MLRPTWARWPTPTDAMLLCGVTIAAMASIAAAPAVTPERACEPPVVQFVTEPKALSAKLATQPDWPTLERLAPPYAEVAADEPAPAPMREARNSVQDSDPVDDFQEKRSGRHKHYRHRWR